MKSQYRDKSYTKHPDHRFSSSSVTKGLRCAQVAAWSPDLYPVGMDHIRAWYGCFTEPLRPGLIVDDLFSHVNIWTM